MANSNETILVTSATGSNGIESSNYLQHSQQRVGICKSVDNKFRHATTQK
jgi:hypothetical protein